MLTAFAGNTCVKGLFFFYKKYLMVVISFKKRFQKLATCFCKAVVFFTVWLLIYPAANAQQNVSYAVHANIIYRFTKYIEWPTYKNTGDFVIGVVGYSPLYEELKIFIANKKVANRKITVKRMASWATFYNCQILFIGEDKSGSIKKIAELTKGSPVLIISETSGQASKGSCINFVIVDERLKLEINKINIEERDLNIASELLRLGTIVQ